MRTKRLLYLLFVALLASTSSRSLAQSNELRIQDTRFLLNGKPFPFTGISFFNALYNPTFNQSPQLRKQWLEKFQQYGINVLRIWGQWDNKRGFVDSSPTSTLYYPDGTLRREHLETLLSIIQQADQLGMVVELALFAQESFHDGIRLGEKQADQAVVALTQALLPYRNVVIQIWNESSHRVLDHVKTVKSIDPKRLVTNSPGYAGVLGEDKQNNVLDFLTPHTSRQGTGRHWEVAPQEIAYLLKRYRKPVVDDEPARNGTSQFGGPKETTTPYDQVVQIYQIWQLGGYIIYHHDMFQTGYNTPAVPPSGIPDPGFNPYHKAVLEFIGQRQRYMP